MSNHHFHQSAGPFTIFLFGSKQVFASRVAKPECRTTIFTGRLDRLLFYYFTISCQFGSRQRFFASRVAEPECRTTIFTGRPDRLLFYYFTILLFHSVPGRGFCISGSETWMSNHHFHRSAGSFCISGSETCMSNHHFHQSAGPFTIYHFAISFPFGSRQRFLHLGSRKPECRTTIFTSQPAVFASRVAKPECRTTIFTGRPGHLFFYYFTI